MLHSVCNKTLYLALSNVIKCYQNTYKLRIDFNVAILVIDPAKTALDTALSRLNILTDEPLTASLASFGQLSS